MDLSSLDSALHPDQRQQAEKDLTRDFRAAALVLTQFYKTSLQTTNQSYNAGYAACLHEIQQNIQATLSVPSGGDNGIDDHGHEDGAGRTLGRLMDWIEARQEALKFEAEDEKEEQAQQQQQRQQQQYKGSSSSAKASSAGETSRAGRQSTERPPVQMSSPSAESQTLPMETEGEAEPEVETTQSGLANGSAPRTALRSKQRDALIEAMNRSRTRSATTPDVDSSDRPEPSNAAHYTLADQHGPDSPSTNEPADLEPEPSSSPILAPTPSVHISSLPLPAQSNNRFRSVHGLKDPHSYRNKANHSHSGRYSNSHPVNVGAGSDGSFSPQLSVDLPVFPFLSESNNLSSFGAFDFSVGNKRPLEAVQTSFGHGYGTGHAKESSRPGLDRSLSARKERRKAGLNRMNVNPSNANAMDLETQEDGSEERERKRPSRKP